MINSVIANLHPDEAFGQVIIYFLFTDHLRHFLRDYSRRKHQSLQLVPIVFAELYVGPSASHRPEGR